MKKVLRILLATLGLLALFSALQLCFAWGRPYTAGGKIRIVDHVVYYRSGQTYVVVDYFDTDAAAQRATAVNIRAEVEGKPVKKISLKSGAGSVERMSCSGFCSRAIVVSHTSARLKPHIWLAMPTAMQRLEDTRMFGNVVGRSVGSFMVAS